MKVDAAIGDQKAIVEKVDASTSVSKGHYFKASNLDSTCVQIEIKPPSKKRPLAPYIDSDNQQIKKSKIDKSADSQIFGGTHGNNGALENQNPKAMSFGDSN